MSPAERGGTGRPKLPPLACDTHFHIFGPAAQFPFASTASYTPPEASLASYRMVMARLGHQRSVIVQPSVYGFDHRCTLVALGALGPAARGVAVLDPAWGEAEVAKLHTAGMRGARLTFHPRVSPRARAEDLPRLADLIRPFGWHVQAYLEGVELPELLPPLEAMRLPLVIDHIGAFHCEEPLAHPGFKRLREGAAAGCLWVKLSAPYLMDATLDQPWLEAMVRALVEAGPDRVLWATNWPHPRQEANPPDEQAWIDKLVAWVEDEPTRHKLFAGNAAALYAF